MIFKHPQTLAPQGIPLHPSQLYDFLSGALIFLILLLIALKKRYEGQVFVWFLILHSTARLITERFRGDDRGIIPGTQMTITQGLATLILIGGVVALFLLRSHHDKKLGTLTQWYSKKLEYPIKVLHSSPEGETTFEYRNIKEGGVADSRFQVPPGYTKMEMSGTPGMGKGMMEGKGMGTGTGGAAGKPKKY